MVEENYGTALRKEIISIWRHSLVYVVGQALSRAVGFFMIPIYTRYISPTDYGAMDLIEIVASAAAMMVSLGVASSMSRFYYAEKDEEKRNRIISTIIIGFGALGAVIVFVLYMTSGYAASLLFDEPRYGYYLQIAVITAWFGMFCEIGFTYLRMLYMSKAFVAITTVQLFAPLFLNILFVVYMKLDILGVFYSTLITQALSGAALCAVILKRVGPRVSVKPFKDLLTFGLPLVPERIGFMLGYTSNRFFLLYFSPLAYSAALTQVGLYSLGNKFGVIVNRFVTVLFNSFWGPRRLELLMNGEGEARETVARVCTYSTFATVYFALLLSTGIESLIDIMADPGYRGAHVVVPFVVLSYVALNIETHFTAGILMARRTSWMTYISILGLLAVLVWNYIFIPRYGITGAAMSNLVGFMVRCVLIYIVSQRLYRIPYELRRMFIMLFASGALFALSQFVNLPSPYLTFFARTGASALFPLALYFFGFYHEGELEFAFKQLKKGKSTALDLLAWNKKAS